MSIDTANVRRQNRLILMLDAFIFILSSILSYFVQPLVNEMIPTLKVAVPVLQYATLILLWLPAWIGADVILRLHRVFDLAPSGWRLIWGLLKLHGVSFVAISAISYATQLDVNRSLVGVFFVFSFLLMFLTRQLVSSRLKQLHKKGIARKNVLLVGAMGAAMDNYARLLKNHQFPPKILGRMAPHGLHEVQGAASIPVLGEATELAEYLRSMPVDEVVFFEPLNIPSENIQLLSACEELGIPALFSVRLDHPTQAAPRFAMRHETPFVLFDVSPKRPDLLAVKDTFDVLAALILVVVFLPVMLTTALAVLVTMGRPILFLQKRAGRYGREFNMLKFRSMKNGAEKQRDALLSQNEMDGPVFKVTNDPRITRLGSFLRRTSLDELPQLFNVLNGTMSLVGPRPLPVKEQEDIQGWRRRRLSMKPGITGIWQVSGRNEISFEDWMKMDIDYIDHWTLWLDIELLLKTIKTVLTAKGAK